MPGAWVGGLDGRHGLLVQVEESFRQDLAWFRDGVLDVGWVLGGITLTWRSARRNASISGDPLTY